MRQPRVAVLVEGESDREALLDLASACGVGLDAVGVVVVAMGAITMSGTTSPNWARKASNSG